MANVYGKMGGSKRFIYHNPIELTVPASGFPVCDNTAETNQLMEMIDTLYAMVSKLFPVITIYSNQKTKLQTRSFVSPTIYARLSWMEQYKGQRYSGSLPQLLQLKDMYLMLDEDWKQDPMLVLRLPLDYQ